jgi:MYXO-CTERM domain-containing protein
MREESCTCDDGTSGLRICKDDGSGFGDCVCVTPPPVDGGAGDAGSSPPVSDAGDDGGCGCRVGAPGSTNGSGWGALLLGVLLAVRTRRRRHG